MLQLENINLFKIDRFTNCQLLTHVPYPIPNQKTVYLLLIVVIMGFFLHGAN